MTGFHASPDVLTAMPAKADEKLKVARKNFKEFIKTAVFSPETTRKLQRLFEDRQISDYDCLEEIDQETAQTDLCATDDLVAACRNYLNI